MKSARRATALLLLLPLAACWEPPVREAVDVVFDAKGGVEVSVVTRLESEREYERKPKARERIVEVREAARCGDDAWTRQLERLSPAALRRSLAWQGGELREVSRVARFEDPRGVERLLEDYPLSLSISRADEKMQLEILPGSGTRATAAERRDAVAALDRFSEAGARYLAALAELWGWLDANPPRERPVVAELLGAGKGEKYEPASEREGLLVKEVEEAMEGVNGFLRLDGERGESLDELSRRVWDPFPATLRVEVAGRVQEAVGFRRDAERSYVVPAVSLQGTLAALAERWVAPDPLAAFLDALNRNDGQGPDLDAFLARPRVAKRPPPAAELRDALERGLMPQPVYRLRWVLPAR